MPNKPRLARLFGVLAAVPLVVVGVVVAPWIAVFG
jgi:hypothetical protein